MPEQQKYTEDLISTNPQNQNMYQQFISCDSYDKYVA